MRHLMTTLAAAGLFLFGVNVSGKAKLRDEIPGLSREFQDQVLDRVWSDLSNSDTLQTPLTSDYPRIDRALEEVSLLAHSINQGDYDPGQFEQTIGAVQNVINKNETLAATTLDTLAGDVRQLRILRNASAGSMVIAPLGGR